MAKSFKTWLVNELVTAALMNAEVRDPFTSIWKFQALGDTIHSGANGDSVNRLAIGNQYDTYNVVSGVPAWKGPLIARVMHIAAQSIPNDTVTDIESFATQNDPEGMHSGTNNYLTPVNSEAGYYLIGVNCWWAASASTTLREISIKFDSSVIVSQSIGAIAGQNMHMNLVTSYYLFGTEKIKVAALQKSGGNLNIASIALWAWRIK